MSAKTDNKLVKTVMDAAVLTGIVAGIGWGAKKVLKENFTSDPSSSGMNYAKFSAVVAGAIAAKQYLEDEKNPSRQRLIQLRWVSLLFPAPGG